MADDGLVVDHHKKKGLTREEKIRRAVLRGELDYLKAEFADNSLDVNWTDQNDATYVHHACFKGNLEVILLLTILKSFCLFT